MIYANGWLDGDVSCLNEVLEVLFHTITLPISALPKFHTSNRRHSNFSQSIPWPQRLRHSRHTLSIKSPFSVEAWDTSLVLQTFNIWVLLIIRLRLNEV